MNWYLNGNILPQISHVCIAGAGIAAWSSVTVPGALVVFIIELVVMLAPLVLTFELADVDDVDVDAEFVCWSMIKLLGIFSIFGIINGVGCTWLPDIDGFIDAAVNDGFNDGGKPLPDADGKCSALLILPKTSWYVRNWLISSMLTCTIWPSALRTSNICGVCNFVSDRICALPPGCDGKW